MSEGKGDLLLFWQFNGSVDDLINCFDNLMLYILNLKPIWYIIMIYVISN